MINKIKIPKQIIILVIAVVVLSLFRVVLFHKFSFIYLIWNLLLAFIPFVLSSIILEYKKMGKLDYITFLVLGIPWLLFLPNAPYIVTDIIHIGEIRSVPLVYDSILLFTSAWAGMLLGMHSLFHIDQVLRMKYSKRVTSIFLVAIMLFTSFGVYLGRFSRFNSWDILVNHSSVLNNIVKIISESNHQNKLFSYTLLFFFFIFMSYSAWKHTELKKE